MSGGGGGGGDGYPVSIRQPQRITVAFTPREFPTPARESSAPLEEEVFILCNAELKAIEYLEYFAPGTTNSSLIINRLPLAPDFKSIGYAQSLFLQVMHTTKTWVFRNQEKAMPHNPNKFI